MAKSICSLTPSYTYELSGYVFETNIFFPELVASEDDATCSIHVLTSVSAKVPEEAFALPSYRNKSLGLQCVKNKQLGFIAVWNSRDVEFVPARSMDESTLRMVILGSVSMILATVLGYVSLHSACVVVNGKAVLFCARSGKGKSSLAAYFYSAGYIVLSDDMTNIKISEKGEILAYPSVPRVKLSESALKQMGKFHDGLEVVPAKSKKYSLPFEMVAQANYPVSSVIFPEFHAGENQIEQVYGKDKLKELLKHLYRKRTSRLLDHSETRNKMLFAMATQLNMSFFKRSEKTEDMEESLAFIKKELPGLV